eukprot:852569-Amphidinium_carterae.1
MERIEAYGQTAVPDILFTLMKKIFPNEDNLRLAMPEEVNRLSFGKSTISDEGLVVLLLPLADRRSL